MSTESASQRRGTEFHSQNSCTCNLSYIDMGGGRGGREEEGEEEEEIPGNLLAGSPSLQGKALGQ